MPDYAGVGFVVLFLPDLLRAACDVPNTDDSPFQLSPMVERLLQERGFAETHLHLGAAADFSLMWANLMHALAVKEVTEKPFESPGACFDDGRKLAKWIMWAATTRLILAEWLFNSATCGIARGCLISCAQAGAVAWMP